MEKSYLTLGLKRPKVLASFFVAAQLHHNVGELSLARWKGRLGKHWVELR